MILSYNLLIITTLMQLQGHKMPGGENFVESDSVTFTRVTRKHAGIYKYAIIIFLKSSSLQDDYHHS